ncbi:MAG: c-type cytochrome [Bacteroidia bacterium]
MKNKSPKHLLTLIVLSSALLFTTRCSSGGTPTKSNQIIDTLTEKGIGPITSVTLGDIDSTMAEKGNTIYASKCLICHTLYDQVVGPALIGISKRRAPEWIMNQILNPTEMIEKDPISKKLLKKYKAPMANLNLTTDEARAILEYFRKNDSQ